MKKCHKCGKQMKLMKDTFPEDGVEYEYHKCIGCGEELLDMQQLHKTAEKYRQLRKGKEIKFQKWGNSIAVRIPKQFISELEIKPEKTGLLLKEKKGLRIIVG